MMSMPKHEMRLEMRCLMVLLAPERKNFVKQFEQNDTGEETSSRFSGWISSLGISHGEMAVTEFTGTNAVWIRVTVLPEAPA